MKEDKDMLKLLNDIESGKVNVEDIDDETADKFLNFLKEDIRGNIDTAKEMNKEIEQVKKNNRALDEEIDKINKEIEKVQKENSKLEEKVEKLKTLTESYTKNVNDIIGDINEE